MNLFLEIDTMRVAFRDRAGRVRQRNLSSPEVPRLAVHLRCEVVPRGVDAAPGHLQARLRDGERPTVLHRPERQMPALAGRFGWLLDALLAPMNDAGLRRSRPEVAVEHRRPLAQQLPERGLDVDGRDVQAPLLPANHLQLPKLEILGLDV